MAAGTERRGTDCPLILASASPQRREILTRLGLEFEVLVPDVEEVAGGDPATDVLENAHRKASAVAARLAEAHEGDAGAAPLIIACDTDVVLDGGILGKPADETEAVNYLRRLSGSEHEVISALVTLKVGRDAKQGIERSTVRFRELSDEQIAWYVGTGEWRGRAGGYAIQGFGSALVAGVRGDLSNVIGLPVPVLVSLAPEIFGG